MTFNFQFCRLPAQFREAQRSFFAKNGVSWHLCVFERIEKDEEGNYRWVVDVHASVIDGAEAQDSSTTYGLFKKSLEIYARAHPHIKRAIVRSDNAGKLVK